MDLPPIPRARILLHCSKMLRNGNRKGFSITHPYKQEVLSYLDSITTASRTPQVLQHCRSCEWPMDRNKYRSGRHFCIAARCTCTWIESCDHWSRSLRTSFRFGCSAASFGFVDLESQHSKGESSSPWNFKQDRGCLQDLKDFDYDLLIQATPVGWDSDEMPVNPDHLRAGKIVIDSIYKDTLLLKRARELGCRTITVKSGFKFKPTHSSNGGKIC